MAALAMALPAAVLHAALPTDTDVSGRTSFVGELLIAAPEMREPFDHAVILLARHNRDGALGIVINHPVASRPIASVLEALGVDSSGVTDSVQVFRGGPVQPNVAFVVHTAEYHHPDTSKSLVAFGYAGWAASQLEDELQRGAWVTVPEDPALVFDDDRAKVWTDAVALNRTNR
ncbi:MAG: YqgE/AlgH family protein [Xanthobacteraceae bacterium]